MRTGVVREARGGLPKYAPAALALLAALWMPSGARAQWTSSNGSTTTANNVRIGNNSAPVNNLDVKSDTTPVGVFVSGQGRALINFQDAAAPPDAKLFQWRVEGGVFRMTSINDAWNNYVNGNIIAATAAGNVGVGTGAPAFRLDVAGQVRSSSGGFVFPDGSVQTTASSGNAPAAGNVSAGQFGANTGGGNFSFPASVLLSGSTGSLIDAGPTNRFRVCGPNGSCTQAGEYVGGRIRLSPDGSFSAAEAATDPGMGGINAPGNVIVGGNLNVASTITAGNIVAKFQDVAEWVPTTQRLAAGTVVVLDPSRSNHVLASAAAYDTAVAGVVSAQPGITLGEGGEGKVKVATTGRVRVRVDATRGPIRIGDLLVTSGVGGAAMRSEAVSVGGVAIHRPGTIIGKALEPLAGGTGEILVLLSMQ